MSVSLIPVSPFTLDELFDRCLVTPYGCRIWLGADSGNGKGGGYGKIRHKGAHYYVHREACAIRLGRRITKQEQVDHLCARWFRTIDPLVARGGSARLTHSWRGGAATPSTLRRYPATCTRSASDTWSG